MLARLQQALGLYLLATALAWLLWWWPESPAVALLGAAFWLAPPWASVGGLMLLTAWLNRPGGAPAPGPRWRDLWAAFWAESWACWRVFSLWQPWRSGAWPDRLSGQPGRRGVVLVHGYVCNRGLWRLWLPALQARGHAVMAVNLEPVFGSIDAYVPLIEQAVRRMTDATGQAPVLVGHSMGGLAIRAWLRAVSPQGQHDDRVHHIVTLGTPHHGTWLGRWGHTTNGRQMRLHSDWLATLARQEPPARYRRFTCWYSHCDNIVLPAPTATLPEADNRHLPATGHVQLVLDPHILACTLAAL